MVVQDLITLFIVIHSFSSVIGKEYWTAWQNYDDVTSPDSPPNDNEILAYINSLLLQFGHLKICRGQTPLAAECRIGEDGIPFDQADTSGSPDVLNISCTPQEGLLCIDGEQTEGRTCQDYQIRFKCSGIEIVENVTWTECNALCSDDKYGVCKFARYTGTTCIKAVGPHSKILMPGRISDCADLCKRGVKVSGVYKISPSDNQGAFDVYCDMETDGGGWTVFQRRQDGSVDFFRDWNDYKTGFGNLSGEFWLGNDRLHQLTSVNNYTLRVDLEDWSVVKKYAVFSRFAIANEADKYRITFGTYSGDAGDSLSHHRGHQFSTKDQDNDVYSGDCANDFNGAWWYGACTSSSLNGIYYKQETTSNTGVYWYSFSNTSLSHKMTEMKIRPAGYN